MIPATSGAAPSRTRPPGGPAHPRLRAWRASAARIPLTVGCVAVLWLLGLGTASVIGGPPPHLDAQVGVGVAALAQGRWWTPLTAALFAPNLISYLATTALLLGLVAAAERRIGPGRTALLLLVTPVAGTLAGTAAVGLGARMGDEWSRQLAVGTAVGPSTAAVGVALGLSARLSALWRRRVRLLLLIGLVMLALYSGLLQDVLRLGCGLVGLLAGPWLLGRRPRRRPLTVSRPEQRVLIALVVAASAAGPLIAAVADTAIGPLSVLRYLLLAPPPDAPTVAQVCLDQAAANDCRALQAQLRLFGIGPAVMSVLPVVLLLVLADGLRRGRRFAWYGVLVGNLALAALGVLLAIEVATTPADRLVVFAELGRTQGLLAVVLPLVQPLLVAGLLVGTRDRFPVTAPAGTYTRLAILTAATLGIASVVYVAGGYLLREQFDRPPPCPTCSPICPPGSSRPATSGRSNPRSCPPGGRPPCCTSGPGWWYCWSPRSA